MVDYGWSHHRTNAFVFVTPEYIHGISGALKNAIDFLYVEWTDKATGFIGYGYTMGARAVEHLRGVMASVLVATVRPQVGLSLFTDFENRAFSDAVKKTGRKRLIVGGLHTEICLTFAVVQALKDGYEGMYVVDAVGGRSQAAHRTAIERMAHAGAVPNTALAVVTELFRDWASPLANKARDVIYWYFGEVARLKATVGVSEVEKKAAQALEHA